MVKTQGKRNRRFRNKCDIVEEPNSSSKYGVRVKVFSLVKRNSGPTLKVYEGNRNQKALLLFIALGMIANVS